MKYRLIALLTFSLCYLSCNRENPRTKHTVKYEVVLSQGGWNGQYTDESGTVQANNMAATWNFSYTAKEDAVNVHIAVIPTIDNTQVTIKLYIDGNLEKTNTMITSFSSVPSAFIYYTF